MGVRFALYLAAIGVGVLIGVKSGDDNFIIKHRNAILTVVLLSLLFIMGIKIGMDDAVIESFVVIGYKAVLIGVFAIIGSLLAVMSIKRFVKGGGGK